MTDARLRHPILVLTAPSGAGKTTIARRLMERLPALSFSVSATTRPPRAGERHGVDYFFLSPEAFRQSILDGDLLEYEEVYEGRYYGTLRSQVEEKTASGPLLLDVDVKGALEVKRIFSQDALTIFVAPPSLEVLERRLRSRNSETEESLAQRLSRARLEMKYQDRFDRVIVNENLDDAVEEAVRAAGAFLGQDEAQPPGVSQ